MLLSCAVLLAGLQDVDVLPLKPGARWEYKGVWGANRAATEVWGVEEGGKKGGHDCRVLRMKKASGDGYVLWVRKSPEGIRIEDAELKNISDEERYLVKFPLKKGAKASVFLSAPAEAEVVAEAEEVKVPAGTFRCVVLTHTTAYPGTTMLSREWLAPGTGFVKFEIVWKKDDGSSSTDTMELQKFTPGR